MKKFVMLSMLVAILMGLLVQLQAQPAPKGPGRGLEQVATISGKVSEWTYNDDFIYDGLYLQTDQEKIFVKFPPHLGTQMRSAGEKLIVNGVFRYTPEGKQELKMVSIEGNGWTVYDQKPLPHTPSRETSINGTAKVSQLQLNKRGDVSGYILENGTILRIPPHVAAQLSQMVQTGSEIGYTGVEKTLKDGEVQVQNYKIVRCQTISINGTQYLVK
ncbi:MAG: hypothetical protein LBQ60_18385 [Bacteroidales bacterium]|nr:hypothetical protein [Bacteroidales bacterium]